MHELVFCVGCPLPRYTAPWHMVRGATFACDNLHHDCSWWCRHDWADTDETWVYEVARAMIGERKPFIVGYYSDGHYTICSRTKECETHGWGDNDYCFLWLPELQKWIPCVGSASPRDLEPRSTRG